MQALTGLNIASLEVHPPTCRYCGSRTNLTLDHVKPVSKGGKFTWDNMVTACMSCNGKKGDNSLKQLGWSLRKKPKVRPADLNYRSDEHRTGRHCCGDATKFSQPSGSTGCQA